MALVKKGGQVYDLPDEQLEKAKAAGYEIATQSDVEAQRARREAGNHPIRTFAEQAGAGLMDAATAIPRAAVGLTEAATGASFPTAHEAFGALKGNTAVATVESAFAGEDTQAQLDKRIRDVEARQAANPISAAAGGLAGAIPGIEATGLGAAGSAARGAIAGEGAGIGARLSAGAAEGAVIQAPLEVSAEAQHAWDEGQRLTGEQATAAVLGGLLTGGIVGGGLGAIGEGAGEVASRLREPEVAAESARPPGAAAKVMGLFSGKKPEDIQELIEQTPRGAELRNKAIYGNANEAEMRLSTRAAEEKAATGEATDIARAEWIRNKEDAFDKWRSDTDAIKAQQAQDDLELREKVKIDKELKKYEGDQVRNQAEREFRGDVNSLEESLRNMSPEWQEKKPANVERMVANDEQSVAEQGQLSHNTLTEAMNDIASIANDTDVYGARGDIRRMQMASRAAAKRMGYEFESPETGWVKKVDVSPADTFVALDNFKRAVGPIGKKAQFASNAAERETYLAAQQIYGGLAQSLEQPAWGAMGEIQASTNKAYSTMLNTADLFRQRLLAETGRDENAWNKVFSADPAKIASWLRRIDDPAKDLDRGITEQHITAVRNLIGQLSSAGGQTPTQVAELEAVTKAADRITARLADLDRVAATNKLDFLKGGSQHGIGIGNVNQLPPKPTVEPFVPPGPKLGPQAPEEFAAEQTVAARNKLQNINVNPLGGALLGAAGVGAIGGGVPGAIGGWGLASLLGAARNPKRVVEIIGIKDRLAAKTAKALASALDHVVDYSEEARVPSQAAASIFMGKYDDPVEAYRARVKQLTVMNDVYQQRVAQRLGGDNSAQFSMSAQVTAARALDYIRQNIPAGLHDMNSPTPRTSQPVPSTGQVLAFQDMWTAVFHPVDVFSDIPSGTVTREQMTAIKTVYPTLYAWARNEALDRIQKMDAAGKELSLDQLAILDNAFELNELAGPTFSVDFAQRWGGSMGDAKAEEQRKAERGGNQRSPGKKPNLGTNMKTLSSTMFGAPNA